MTYSEGLAARWYVSPWSGDGCYQMHVADACGLTVQFRSLDGAGRVRYFATGDAAPEGWRRVRLEGIKPEADLIYQHLETIDPT